MYMTLMLVINNASNRAIGIISLERLFSKFYRRHHKLVSKFSVGLKSLLHQGLSELEFYDDLVYKFKRLWVGLIFLIGFEK